MSEDNEITIPDDGSVYYNSHRVVSPVRFLQKVQNKLLKHQITTPQIEPDNKMVL